VSAAFRVAVIDDDAAMRELVGGYLGLSGFVVRAFGSGDEALPAMAADPPDLVIVDVQMPGLDGFGVVESMRRETALADVPVLLLSALDAPHVKVRGLEAGADDYIVKHSSPSEILARVRTGLRRAARYRRLQGTMAGNLGPDLGLDVLVQTLSLGTRAACLRLTDLAADLVCAGGAVRACRFGRLRDAQALERVVLLARGRFSVQFIDAGAEANAPPLDLLSALVAADEARERLRAALGREPAATVLRRGDGALGELLAPYEVLLPAPALSFAASLGGELAGAVQQVIDAIVRGGLKPGE
jgi:DNA-binding response OmpR family regulator